MLDVERLPNTLGEVFRHEDMAVVDVAARRVDPMPPRNLPDWTAHDNHNSTQYIGRSKGPIQPSPLDAALLCSKLNVHKREQDALRRSREKRESFRNGQYRPRSAARSFAATTTTTHDEMTPPSRTQKHISEPLPIIAEPFAMEQNTRVPQRQPQASMNSGLGDSEYVPKAPVTTRTQKGVLRSTSLRHAPVLTEEPTMLEEEVAHARLSEEQFDLAAALAAIEPQDFNDTSPSERHDSKRNSAKSQKHDCMNPAANGSHAPDFHSLVTLDLPELQPLHEMASLPDLQPLSGLQSTPLRRRSSAHSEEVESSDRGRARYRPGDAAKRRTVIDPVPRSQQDRSMSSTYHTEARMSRFLEQEVVLNTTIPEVDTPPVLQRPKLSVNDRPDWSQPSETGDEVRHALNLHVFSHREQKTQRSQSALLESSMLAQFAGPMAPEQPRRPSETKVFGGPQNDHMIADAVKIIQREKKVKWRASVVDFLKKL